MESRKFFVTGGNGFLGIHLISKLIESGVQVVGYVRRSPGSLRALYADQIFSKIIWKQGSLASIDELANAMEGCAGVYHLAGSVIHSRTAGGQINYPQSIFETNVTYSVNIMRAAAKAGVKRVVMASTSGVVGCRKPSSLLKSKIDQFVWGTSPPETPNDNSPYCTEIVQNWPYYLSKIKAEQQTLSDGIISGVEVIWMRPSMMIGPGDINFRSIKLILSFLHQSTPIVPNGTISVVDVRDVAEAFIVAMDKGKPYRGYLLSSLDCSLGEFYQILHDISGVPAPKLKGIPNGLIITGSKFIDCYNRHWKGQWDESFDPVRAEMSGHDWSIDCSAAKEELNFTPRDPITSLTETIEWIESQEQTTPILSRL